MARSNEPLWWMPFSAGMMIGALFVPALIIITGIILPYFRPDDAADARILINHPLTKIFLVAVISLSFFHWAHKFRYLLFDLGIKGGRTLIAILCYGTAIGVTLYAVAIALNLDFV